MKKHSHLCVACLSFVVLGALGFGLLFLSYSALRHARASSSDLAEGNFTILDLVPSASDSIDKYLLSPFQTIFIRIPSCFVSKIGSFLHQTFWIYPVTMMKQCVPTKKMVWSGIGIIVNTSKTALYYVIVKPPSALYRTIVSFIKRKRKINGRDSNDGSVIL